MNMLITKGYAKTKAQATGSGTAHLEVTVDCGCNCKCCQGVKEKDLWKASKDCGCDCGCCALHGREFTKKPPHPQYYCDKDGALKAARELVGRNLKLEGEKLEEYLNMNFGEVWDHYDVLGTGLVEIEQMASFYKKLMKDYSIAI